MRNDVSVVGFSYRPTPKVFGDVSVLVLSAVSYAIAAIDMVKEIRLRDMFDPDPKTGYLARWGSLILCLEQSLR
jgi:hypothetical protein